MSVTFKKIGRGGGRVPPDLRMPENSATLTNSTTRISSLNPTVTGEHCNLALTLTLTLTLTLALALALALTASNQLAKPNLDIAAKFGRNVQTSTLPKLPSWLLGTCGEGPRPAEVPSIIFAFEHGGVGGAWFQGAVRHDISLVRSHEAGKVFLG